MHDVVMTDHPSAFLSVAKFTGLVEREYCALYTHSPCGTINARYNRARSGPSAARRAARLMRRHHITYIDKINRYRPPRNNYGAVKYETHTYIDIIHRFREANELATTRAKVVTAAHGHSQRRQHRVTGFLSRNRISNGTRSRLMKGQRG
ncbi:hypothetical protein EVAR_48876_1 [Eumeta japonica]|uniref:Uncharacterized protein n=1 Tax=Eumeta variegata TaxID=151549 RepID=A0A4C1Y3W7_EUMVA|nr:hypothetical protein EVAR_48876_1 [Eumeta japonica]